LTIGTGNKSELCVGYFTKYGDGGVDLLPLADLYKAEVRELAKELGIPDELIKRPPTAGLWHGQTDEEELGITYEELDKILDLIDRGQEDKIDNSDNLNKVKEMIKRSEHKRAPIEFFKKQGGI
jgi:NAD+ synthase